VLPKTCTNSGSWQRIKAPISGAAGHTVTLVLSNHDDGDVGDATDSRWDDFIME
jgi:hypothetical protein